MLLSVSPRALNPVCRPEISSAPRSSQTRVDMRVTHCSVNGVLVAPNPTGVKCYTSGYFVDLSGLRKSFTAWPKFAPETLATC